MAAVTPKAASCAHDTEETKWLWWALLVPRALHPSQPVCKHTSQDCCRMWNTNACGTQTPTAVIYEVNAQMALKVHTAAQVLTRNTSESTLTAVASTAESSSPFAPGGGGIRGEPHICAFQGRTGSPGCRRLAHQMTILVLKGTLRSTWHFPEFICQEQT